MAAEIETTRSAPAVDSATLGVMPELPEVESLASYLRATAAGLRVSRVELAAISALKTFDPPVTALVGAPVFLWLLLGRRGGLGAV